MSYGPTHELSADDKDMVWKFRHHLTRDKRVRAVNLVVVPQLTSIGFDKIRQISLLE